MFPKKHSFAHNCNPIQSNSRKITVKNLVIRQVNMPQSTEMSTVQNLLIKVNSSKTRKCLKETQPVSPVLHISFSQPLLWIFNSFGMFFIKDYLCTITRLWRIRFLWVHIDKCWFSRTHKNCIGKYFCQSKFTKRQSKKMLLEKLLGFDLRIFIVYIWSVM